MATVAELEQSYILCPAEMKDAYLVQLLKDFLEEKPNSLVIVFSHTCKWVPLLSSQAPPLSLHSLGHTHSALATQPYSLSESHQVSHTYIYKALFISVSCVHRLNREVMGYAFIERDLYAVYVC